MMLFHTIVLWVWVVYKSNGMRLLVALVGADDLGVHPREVVVDVVLLLVGVSLDGWSDRRGSQTETSAHTGASMHWRNFCSSSAQPCTL